MKATSYTSPVRQAPLKDSNKNDESGGKVTAKAKRDRMPFPSSTDCSSASAKSCLSNHNSSSYEHLHHKPQTNTKKTNHQGNGKLILINNCNINHYSKQVSVQSFRIYIDT